ncbi:hypothetical protein CspHIS471_0303460 [Cutaneotrichosporon sp. HIS471]|nr:hypothetical protein CspHIS471_0303460 [Cutaneotrichosporon sp. HIS471]
MLFSQFHERLEHNLAKHNLSVKSLLDMSDFTNLPRSIQLNVMNRFHDSLEPQCRHRPSCAVRMLEESLEQQVSPSLFLWKASGFVATRAEAAAKIRVAKEGARAAEDTIAKVKQVAEFQKKAAITRALGRAKREAAAERAQAVLLVKQQAVRVIFAAVTKAVASGRERFTQAIEAERQQHQLTLATAMSSAAAEQALALGKAVDTARACIVCYEEEASQMPYTCQHAMFCHGCAVRIVRAKNGCPICHRRSVRPKKKWRVFLP